MLSDIPCQRQRIARTMPRGTHMALYEVPGQRQGVEVEEVGKALHFRANKTYCRNLFKTAAEHGYTNPMKWFLDFVIGRPCAVIPADIMGKIADALTEDEGTLTVECRPRQKRPILCRASRTGILITVDKPTWERLSTYAELDSLPGGPAGAVVATFERKFGRPVTGGELRPTREARMRLAAKRDAKLERRAEAA